MPKLTKPDGSQEPYTMIPNRVIRSQNIDVHAKLVYACIASCGEEAFPSYEALQEWTASSRDRVWKSLRLLEQVGAIRRFKKGKRIYYKTHWADDPGEEFHAVHYTGAPSVRITDGSTEQSVRQTDGTSPPNGPESVRQTDPIKNPDKDLLKTEESCSVGDFVAPNVVRIRRGAS